MPPLSAIMNGSGEALPTGLPPGSHVAVVTSSPLDAIPYRRLGMTLRDSVSVLMPGPRLIVVLLFRMPLDQSVAANVLAHRTGAISVDGCRVRHTSPADFAHHREMVERIRQRGGSWQGSWKNTSDLANANEVSTAGRWPPNVVLLHDSACVNRGARAMRPLDGPRRSPVQQQADGNIQFTVKPVGYQKIGYTGDDGTEQVPDWQCSPGCPIYLLDNATQHLHGAWNRNAEINHVQFQKVYDGGWGPQRDNPNYHENKGGGASRFFPQLPDTDGLMSWLYTLIDPGEV